MRKIIRKKVLPFGISAPYLYNVIGPFKMIVEGGYKEGWAKIYKGNKKVFECNATFAKKWFSDIK